MMQMQLAMAAEILQARMLGTDVAFQGVSTDTRSLQPGNLFIALRGPNFNGDQFVAQAQERGAAAAVVGSEVKAELPLLQVTDTRIALGQLAAHWRRQFSIPLVGITGSNGKTTVKEMLAAILSQGGQPLVTRGNFNNDIGMPLTLCRLGNEHDTAVIEMGANHLGEIAYLADIAQPTVGVVNNAGPAHLEGFGSLLGVAQGKGEMFSHLPMDATAIINAEDRYAPLWRELAGDRKQLTFALDTSADVMAHWQGDECGSALLLKTPAGEMEVNLALPGRHNVMNALAATAAALAMGADLARVRQGLEALRPVGGRLQMLHLADGSRVLDDTYNANPASLRAGLEVLSRCSGSRWLVLGDMGELGEKGALMHQQMAKLAREAGIDRLFLLGELAATAAPVFGEGATVCASMEDLMAALQQQWSAEVVVLVKGSRRMAMERVIQGLGAHQGVASATEGLH